MRNYKSLHATLLFSAATFSITSSKWSWTSSGISNLILRSHIGSHFVCAHPCAPLVTSFIASCNVCSDTPIAAASSHCLTPFSFNSVLMISFAIGVLPLFFFISTTAGASRKNGKQTDCGDLSLTAFRRFGENRLFRGSAIGVDFSITYFFEPCCICHK